MYFIYVVSITFLRDANTLEMFAFFSFHCIGSIVEKSRSTNMFILEIVYVGHTIIADKRSQSWAIEFFLWMKH